MNETAKDIQRAFYARTAASYDKQHLAESEHELAAAIFIEILRQSGGAERAILDVGAGTGRFQRFCTEASARHRVVGVEPVPELRRVGHDLGIAEDCLIDGDGAALPFEDDSFDFATEFGVLHHVRDFEPVVREMCRVARDGVVISDTNNMGEGSFASRIIKNALKWVGLWPLFIWIQTRGKGYKVSEGDGVYYSFCAFDTVSILREKFPNVRYFTTVETKSSNLRFGVPQIFILATRVPILGSDASASS